MPTTARPEWVEGSKRFSEWKRRRLVSNKELAQLTGISLSRIDKKLNARAPTPESLWTAIANIDKVIVLGGFPENASERMRRNIVTRRIR